MNRFGIKKTTRIICPKCGMGTGVNLRSGEIISYCRHCKIEIEVSIRITERREGKEEKLNVDDEKR